MMGDIIISSIIVDCEKKQKRNQVKLVILQKYMFYCIHYFKLIANFHSHSL